MWLMYAQPTELHAIRIVNRESNTSSTSTKLPGHGGTLRKSPSGQGVSPSAARASLAKARDIRKPLTVTIWFVGNGDCEWRLKTRGKVYKAHGCENVHEVLARLSKAHLR